MKNIPVSLIQHIDFLFGMFIKLSVGTADRFIGFREIRQNTKVQILIVFGLVFEINQLQFIKQR